jgi:hypothetical protein
MADENKVLVNLTTGLEDAERVTVAFLVATAALSAGITCRSKMSPRRQKEAIIRKRRPREFCDGAPSPCREMR